MNILLRFEDSYGCYSLFTYCQSILNNKPCSMCNVKVAIERGLTCNGVFTIDLSP